MGDHLERLAMAGTLSKMTTRLTFLMVFDGISLMQQRRNLERLQLLVSAKAPLQVHISMRLVAFVDLRNLPAEA
jgi:hypothetical protein